jgi:ATP-dependent RNA helicase RhlE
MNFSDLGLLPALARRCATLGYAEPTPIQAQAIPVILSGADLIGCAATGTGKTAAFLLPLLQKLYLQKGPAKQMSKYARALILAPTRELAGQIAETYRELDISQKLRAVTLTGGANMNRQRMELMRGAPVVIATPGRLLDHLDGTLLDLSRVEVLVLDEADRMLDLGFWPAIQQIMRLLPSTRQTLLFSATMSPAIERSACAQMRQPQLIEVDQRGQAAVTVEQKAYPVALESKNALLFHLLERERFERVLIFTRTRRGAERLALLLAARKHQVDRIHADRTQPQREAALQGFKTGRYRILVATDVAARGIDVEAVSHVINFDVPEAPEDYVHRIGRSGRAGLTGQAITLVTLGEEPALRAIEQLTRQKIERVVLPGFGGRELLVKPSVPSFAAVRGGFGTRSFAPRR